MLMGGWLESHTADRSSSPEDVLCHVLLPPASVISALLCLMDGTGRRWVGLERFGELAERLVDMLSLSRSAKRKAESGPLPLAIPGDFLSKAGLVLGDGVRGLVTTMVASAVAPVTWSTDGSADCERPTLLLREQPAVVSRTRYRPRTHTKKAAEDSPFRGKPKRK